MINPPALVQTEACAAAVIRLTIPRHEIQQVMGPAIQEVMKILHRQGQTPAGPVFSRHFDMQPDTFDFEVGVPVLQPITPSGRVYNSSLPAATAIQTVYTGPYEGLGDGWGEFMEWIYSSGHPIADGLWERYILGPESSPDPSTWQTELNKPLLP
jgi:effector-binding domain-containing protein